MIHGLTIALLLLCIGKIYEKLCDISCDIQYLSHDSDIDPEFEDDPDYLRVKYHSD